MNTIFPALCWPASVLTSCPGNFSFKLTRCIKMAASWKGSFSPSPWCNSSILPKCAKQMWMLAHCDIPVYGCQEKLKMSCQFTNNQPVMLFVDSFFLFHLVNLKLNPSQRKYLSRIGNNFSLSVSVSWVESVHTSGTDRNLHRRKLAIQLLIQGCQISQFSVLFLCVILQQANVKRQLQRSRCLLMLHKN